MKKTKIKIFVAKCLYRLLKIFIKNDVRTITRNGITYEVNLSEAIDLTLFLSGSFQKEVFASQYYKIPEDAVVFDVGANMGSMSLPFADITKKGKVFSFEPTHHAFSKFKKNLSLNTELAQRITLINTFVSDKITTLDTSAAYSSWSLTENDNGNEQHQIHGGAMKSSSGVGIVTLDEVVEKEKIKRLDFLKIDTDGHELYVLKGGINSIQQFKPVIVFEVGAYLLTERGIEFTEFLDYFKKLNYQLFCTQTNREVRYDNYQRAIPPFSTTDIIAMPLNS
jgi:FkbM family methyltransferase